MSTTHSNNFDFIRFVAATLVWYDHCYALKSLADPLSSRIQIESFGSLGVAIFFIISGYFVTMSYVTRHRLVSFVTSRFLRIMPALVGVVLLSVFLLGPAVTSLSALEYFTNPLAWNYLKSLLIFPLQYDLPGVFSGNPSHAVNGSLWTLQHEVRLYGFVALLGFLGVLRPRVALLLCMGLFSLRIYGTVMSRGMSPEQYHWGRWSWGKLSLSLQLASLFAGGAFMYLARERIKLNFMFFIISGACLLVSAHLPHGEILFELALIYIVIYLGFLRLPLLPSFSKYGDFSYGMYLYAFPMQQLTLHLLGSGGSFTAFMVMSFALTLLLAILSWHIVEKPALALKSR